MTVRIASVGWAIVDVYIPEWKPVEVFLVYFGSEKPMQKATVSAIS